MPSIGAVGALLLYLKNGRLKHAGVVVGLHGCADHMFRHFRENDWGYECRLQTVTTPGGSGTRLYPVTKTICKQLIPIYDKPMVYYPLSVIMLAGIRDILIISTPEDLPRFEELFGSGEHLGLRFSYAVQTAPRKRAQCYTYQQVSITTGCPVICGAMLLVRINTLR